MRAEIITIGDELLRGFVVDTNAAYIGKKLLEVGIKPFWVTTVGDDQNTLLQAFTLAAQRVELVFVTGGLGPTHDDVTKKVACKFFDSELVFNQLVFKKIVELFQQRGVEMPAINEEQAWIPKKAQLILNEVGTAPGFIFNKDGCYFFIMPGVPQEMKAMMEGAVIPFLINHKLTQNQTIQYQILRTTGIMESQLYEKLSVDLANIENLVELAFVPTVRGVDLRLTAIGKSAKECRRRIASAESLIRRKVDDYIYGVNEETLEQKVAELLFANKQTIAVAESCTGGLISNMLTNISGSSHYFERGIVAYSNQAKVDILGVSIETLRKFGAVSSETAGEMAEGVRRLARTNFGLSTTGIAGPTGGTPQKPVGLVYIGLANGSTTIVEKYQFHHDRLRNKQRTAYAALNLLRRRLLKKV